MSTSLFDTLEAFSLQSEMALDEIYGLTSDVWPGELENYLDLQLDNDDGVKPEAHSQKLLEDFLIPDTTGDAFGDDWMETVNISSLLDNQPVGHDRIPAITDAPLKATVELKVAAKPEVRVEGLKPSAYELLKALLTTDASLSQPLPEVPAVPEAEVPSFNLLARANATSHDIESFRSNNEEIESFRSSNSCIEPLSIESDASFEIQPVVAFDNGDVAEIGPVQLDSFVHLFGGQLEASSPLSDEMESVLSSPGSPATITLHPVSDTADNTFTDTESSFPSSPASPGFLFTINSSQLHSDNSMCSDKSSQISDTEFTQVKTRTVKKKSCKDSRASPYDQPVEYEKKDRKRVQNKNAATRYRVKKRSEKESLFEQEKRLGDKNQQLKEKVESLRREISYMKELMHEIQKAKQSKI